MRAQADSAPRAAPDDLSQWALHCFCLHARLTPQRVVRLDDNGRILHACRRGASQQSLRERGLATTQSALTLLVLLGLLQSSGDALRTTFPIVDADQCSDLRRGVDALAAALAPTLASPLASLRASLDAAGWGDSARAVVFGHALDGLFWDELRRQGLIGEHPLSLERPYWSGTFWATYPPRQATLGMNRVAGADGDLWCVWSADGADAIAQVEHHAMLDAAVRDLLAGRPGVALRFADGSVLALSDAEGRSRIPVIRRRADDALHGFAQALARSAAAALVQAPLVRTAAAMCECSEEDAAVIAGHELIWNLADRWSLSPVGTPARTACQVEGALFVQARR
jgi:hypothetical protein